MNELLDKIDNQFFQLYGCATLPQCTLVIQSEVIPNAVCALICDISYN